MFIKLSAPEKNEIIRLEGAIKTVLTEVITSRAQDPNAHRWTIKRDEQGDMYLVTEDMAVKQDPKEVPNEETKKD